MTFTSGYLAEVQQTVRQIDQAAIERCVALLAATRSRGGRVFVLGVGGSAGNASHAVNDFRKLAGLEAYAPTDNVSELTARTNDEGWSTVFEAWLRTSRLRADDLIEVRRPFAEPIGAPETIARYVGKLVVALCSELELRGMGE